MRKTSSGSELRAFTLIELLVVIAIIGILSAVVLASLNTARAKGSDASIKSNMESIRVQAELYYDSNSAYGANSSAEYNCAATDNMFSDPVIKSAVSSVGNIASIGNVRCNVAAKGSAWALSAPLSSVASTWWCVDSTGVSKSESRNLSGNPPETVCP